LHKCLTRSVIPTTTRGRINSNRRSHNHVTSTVNDDNNGFDAGKLNAQHSNAVVAECVRQRRSWGTTFQVVTA
jgi:hypothetical protein